MVSHQRKHPQSTKYGKVQLKIGRVCLQPTTKNSRVIAFLHATRKECRTLLALLVQVLYHILVISKHSTLDADIVGNKVASFYLLYQ